MQNFHCKFNTFFHSPYHCFYVYIIFFYGLRSQFAEFLLIPVFLLLFSFILLFCGEVNIVTANETFQGNHMNTHTHTHTNHSMNFHLGYFEFGTDLHGFFWFGYFSFWPNCMVYSLDSRFPIILQRFLRLPDKGNKSFKCCIFSLCYCVVFFRKYLSA